MNCDNCEDGNIVVNDKSFPCPKCQPYTVTDIIIIFFEQQRHGGEYSQCIEEIVQCFIEYSDYDGLFNTDCGCSCYQDVLAPCETGALPDCQCGYKRLMNKEERVKYQVTNDNYSASVIRA